MQIRQERAYKEVQRLTGSVSRAKWSKSAGDQDMIPILEDELEMARVILAFERGMSQLHLKGGHIDLTEAQTNELIDYIKARQTR